MSRIAKYRCPVCKKPLTKAEFERAFKIHEGQKEHLEARQRLLDEREREFATKAKRTRKAIREAERQRTRRILAGKVCEIGRLKERIKLLERGKSPQEFGPEFEAKLVKRLREQFREDDIKQTAGSRGGDVLHIVKEAGQDAGRIIYECKWTPMISRSHVRQTARAKMSRQAQFAVLVTCGKRRGFNGLDTEFGVTIVAPTGALALAGLLRNHLVEMFRAGIEKRKRTKIANQLLKFVKSPEFRNPIEEVIHTAENLREGILEEFRWHKSSWEKRWEAYGAIRWDALAVQENVKRVLRGDRPRQIAQPKEALALPAPT